MNKNRLCVLIAVGFACLGICSAYAQQEPNLETGLRPYGSYQGGDIDSINLSNGNVTIKTGLWGVPQRGGKLNMEYFLVYNGKGYFMDTSCDPNSSCTNFWNIGSNSALTYPGDLSFNIVLSQMVNLNMSTVVLGYNNGVPSVVDYLYSVTSPDGAKHQIGNFPHAAFAVGSSTNGPSGRAIDGSGWFISAGVGMFDRNGVQHWPLGNSAGFFVKDPNGNQMGPWNPTQDTFTDTMGRTLPAVSSKSGVQTTDLSGCAGSYPTDSAWIMSLPGLGSGTANFKLCFANIPVLTNFRVAAPEFATHYGGATNGNFPSGFLQSVVLPDGTAWVYDHTSRDPGDPTNINYGDLTKITFPTGGTLSYVWSNVGFPSCATPAATPVSRAVTSRTLDAHDGAGPRKWTYSYLVSGVRQPLVTTVVDPLGNRTVHTFTDFALAQDGACGSYYETQIQYFDSSNNILKTVTTDYTPVIAASGLAPLPSPVLPIRTTTTLRTGQVTKTELSYSGAFIGQGIAGGPTSTVQMGQLSDKYEYDFGPSAPGPLLRHTHTDYVQSDFNSSNSANLLDLPTDQVVYDGAGNRAAETDYAYDESVYLTSANISTQHGTPPAGVRGNLTTVRKWSNTGGPIVGHANWYDSGEVYQQIDPLGYTTTHSYDSAYVGAYSTKTCNALSQCVSGTYDFNTGLLTSLTNVNATTQASGNTPGDSAHTTTYSYDSMARLTSATAPPDPGNGGAAAQTTFAFSSPGTFPFNVQKQTSVTNSLTDSATAYFDGLGRAYQSQHVLSNGTAIVNTTFDGVGHVASVTNPFFYTTELTYGVTSSQYDTLGRITQVTKQDNSSSTVSYSDNCTTATDEVGKQRKSCSDALGRLTGVWEDPAGLNYETDYQYDTLGNLLRVDQKGSAPGASAQWRTRTFTYDSLSRLLTATNPESGTIYYFYDPNGNLLQKVMPSPNQTGSAQHTVSYCYDPLNRVNGKAYSWQNCQNGQLPAGTAVVSYAYDQGANAIGKLSSFTDQAGSGSYSYDVLGRIASEQRIINGVTKNLSYSYNLNGSVKTVTYPSGATITYTPDSAGRILSAVDTSNNINYVTGAKYGPAGPLTDSVYGQSTSFTGIVNSFSFNSRLQPATMWSSSPVRTLMYLVYDFHVNNGDNGNVFGITNYRDQTRSQTFTYDTLNRLTSAQNAGTDCTQTVIGGKTKYWGNSYGYDAWGNLLTKTQTKCSPENLILISNAQNRADNGLPAGQNYNYDAAGNMTADPTDLVTATYDAENRIATVTKNSATTTYTYDDDGNRVKKANGSTGTLYWYMTPGIVGESDLSGNLKTEYVFFDGERVARRDFPAGNVSYYFSDHLKTASVVTDASGTILDESDYYPWGGELQFTNNLNNHYKFTGQERDSESSLDYFGARYYSNGLGKWVTPDAPFADQHLGDPQSWNLYAYVRNNPVSLVDHTGHGAVSAEVKKALKILEKKVFAAARKEAVRLAWKQERELVLHGKGTRNWTKAQIKELIEKGTVKGFQGHHINNVADHDLKMAKNPNNIKFVEGLEGNLEEHGGDFHNKTTGGLIDRLEKLSGSALLTFFTVYEEKSAEYQKPENCLFCADPNAWWFASWNMANNAAEDNALLEALDAAFQKAEEERKQAEEEKKKANCGRMDQPACTN
jgi:RHS repeat-associated protein